MGTIAEDLETDAVVSYNGYLFSPAANILKVSHQPIPDQAGRTITHTLHTFIIEDILQASDQLDGTKVDTTKIRQQLLVMGGQFQCAGVGVGPFAVNASLLGVFNVGARDCKWGPRPTLLTWENYGNGKAGKIVWQMQCCTPEQCADPAFTRQVMAYNYAASFSKDAAGYQRRSISGYIEIPLTRKSQNDRTVQDSVDRLRESCYPDIPVGWNRPTDDWKVSMDRRRADFNYVDEEQPPNAPAEHVVSCEETHSVQTDGISFTDYMATFSGTYEMTKKKARSESWDHFTRFCQSRIDALRKVQTVSAILPRKLHMEEPIHGRTSGSFRLDVSYISKVPDPKKPGEFVGTGLLLVREVSALWTDLLESDWNAWKKSMKDDDVFKARGPANTSLPKDPTSDLLIDLCLNQPTPTLRANVQVAAAGASRSKPGIKFPDLTPESSFLAYRLGMRVEDMDGVVELKPLPTSPLQYIAQDPGVASTDGFVDKPYSNTPTSVFQDRPGTISVTLYGVAIRAGYNISPPVLVSVGGLVARRQNRPPTNFFQTWLHGNYGTPVVGAAWSQRFILPAPPSAGFGAPANPLYGGVAQGGGFRLK